MLPKLFLILYFIIIQFWPSLAIECWRGEEPLPLYDDCHKIVDALALAARNPEENLLKTWGFFLEDTRRTARLPKGYYIHNPITRQRNECGVSVDAIIQDPIATDHFRLGDVAWAAHRVLTICLASGKRGEEFPGARYNPRLEHRVRVRFLYRPGARPLQLTSYNSSITNPSDNGSYQLGNS